MSYDCKMVADSISPIGDRLVTLQITLPRIVLAEFNTHRVFCLAGDSELEFDLPSGGPAGRRVFRMRIDEFVDKWYNGARRYGTNPRMELDLDIIEDDEFYNAPDLADLVGFANTTNINSACRTGTMVAEKASDGRTWKIQGREFKRWREDVPTHSRFDVRNRLSEMRIRQLNEFTGEIITSTVKDCRFSGTKKVYRITVNGKSIKASEDHLFRTEFGFVRLGDLIVGKSRVVLSQFGKPNDEKLDPIRLKKIDGKWRSVFQRRALDEYNGLCQNCNENYPTQTHHTVLVSDDVSKAFDYENILFVCDDCHKKLHEVQGWQGGTYLYGKPFVVESIQYVGEEKTFDLEIDGVFPNFVANGFVVHNSRNSASSRAIPIERMIEMVERDPFVPIYWGRNQKGMQAHEELNMDEKEQVIKDWLLARNNAVKSVKDLSASEVHKQIANRLLEPFMWSTIVCTATEWSNFFALRCPNGEEIDPEFPAQPEIQKAAILMRRAMNESTPTIKEYGQWHTPYISDEEASLMRSDIAVKVSIARCARVSYVRQMDARDYSADVNLFNRLVSSGHCSPLEHIATPLAVNGTFPSNFTGWVQFRKTIDGEADYSIHRNNELDFFLPHKKAVRDAYPATNID